jgi:hypothetical protein
VFGGMMKASYAASCERGVQGFAQEVSLLVRGWGFRLEVIRVPVHLWHAEGDRRQPLRDLRALGLWRHPLFPLG